MDRSKLRPTVYGTEILSKSGTKLIKFMTRQTIPRVERSAQKNNIDEEDDDNIKNDKDKISNVQDYASIQIMSKMKKMSDNLLTMDK